MKRPVAKTLSVEVVIREVQCCLVESHQGGLKGIELSVGEGGVRYKVQELVEGERVSNPAGISFVKTRTHNQLHFAAETAGVRDASNCRREKSTPS